MKSRRTRVCLSVVLQANTVFYEKSSGHRSHLRQSHKCLPQDKDHILERSGSAPCALPILSYGILKRCALKGLDLIKLIFIASSGHFKVSPWLFFLQRHGTEQHNGYSCPCFCIQVQLSTQSKKKKSQYYYENSSGLWIPTRVSATFQESVEHTWRTVALYWGEGGKVEQDSERLGFEPLDKKFSNWGAPGWLG